MSDPLQTLHRMGSNLVVQAGAGTGKTFNLVKLYVHLLAGLTHNAPRRDLGLRMGDAGLAVDGSLGAVAPSAQRGFRPDQIVAMTFTDKAAAEMRERIQAKLAELERAPEGDEHLNASARALGRPLPSPRRWRELRLELSHAFIGTFHSFCGRILRENAVAAGVDPRFLLMGAQGEDRELFEEVAKEIILGETKSGGAAWRALYRFRLSQEQQFGGGLLSHLKALYDRLQVTGRGPEGLLDGSPYDEHQARQALIDAVERYTQTLQELTDAADALTGKTKAKLKALGSWLSEHRAALSGLDERAPDTLWALLDEPDALLHNGRFGDFKPLREETKALRKAVDEARVTFEAIPIAQDVQALLTQVWAAFERKKAEQGSLDFQDLLVRARNLLRDNPTVRRQIKGDVGVLLVDEFQDTDQLQKDLIYLMAEDRGGEAIIPPGTPVGDRVKLAKAKLFVVGDRKQSIYAFRGADVEIFEETLTELSQGRLAGEAPRAPLSLNLCRRSLPALISASNRLFAQLMQGDDGPGFDANLDALGPFRPEHDVACAMALMDFSEVVEGAPDVGAMNADERARLQAKAVAARIEAMIADGAPRVHEIDGDRETPRAPRYADITILLKRYKNLAAFTTELILRRIPHVVVKGRGFYGAQEVRDLINFLRLITDPEAHVALLGVLRSPLVGLNDEALVSLALSRQPRPALRLRDLAARFIAPQAAPSPPTLPPGLSHADVTRLSDMLHLHRRLRRQADRLGCAGLIEAIIDATGFTAALAATFQGEQKVANVEKLLNLARDFDQGGAGGVPAFIHKMLPLLDSEPREGAAAVQGEDDDVVRIMTVHASKGLEFPIVIIPECDAGQPGNLPPLVFDKRHGFAISLPNPAPDKKSTPTGAYAQIRQAHKNRGISESQRLLYVAITRAREHVLLTGAGKARAHTWLRWLQDAAPALRDEGLLATTEGLALAMTPYPDFQRTSGPEDIEALGRRAAQLPEAAREAGRRQLASALPPDPESITVRRLVAPVTQLDDFQLCPRRYLLWHELSLEEHPNLRGNRPEDREVSTHDAPIEETAAQLDPLRRGTLAHALLEKIDLGALSRASDDGEALVAAMLEDQGYTLTDPQVAGVASDVTALLASPFGEGLRASPASSVQREWPFTLRLVADGGMEIFLTGKMDLLIHEDGGALRVIDYKHTRREGRTAEDYRFQLMAYSLAARSRFGATDIRAEIVFLRDRDHPWSEGPMTLRPTPQQLDAFEAELTALGTKLVRARLSDRFQKSELTHCEAVHCGYRWRCHPPAHRSRGKG